MSGRSAGWAVATVCLGLGLVAARAQEGLRLPAVFSDHAVLQQGQPLPVWGWAPAGAQVTVRLAGQEKSATAGADGRWQVTLAALKPGAETLEMTVSSGPTTLTRKDVLVGEVWVCSGQSNMQFGLNGAANAAQEVAAADYPRMRLFATGYAAPEKPATDAQGQWVACTPQTVPGFTAVGYFFGRRLHRELGVPVGLIQSAVGGTPAESWTSREGLAGNPDLAHFVQALDQALAAYPEALKQYQETLAALAKDNTAVKKDDTGWAAPAFDDQAWKPMALPARWEDIGLNLDGVVWFRRTVDIPATWVGKDLALSLGPIDDQDLTYVNGEKVGETGAWDVPRKYTVPARLATSAKLAVAIRVTDTGGAGGVYGQAADLAIVPAVGTAVQAVSLAGPWRYDVAQEARTKPQPPMGPGNAWLPTGLYNGMIAPLVPYAIAGAIWYQGESNAGRAYQYRTLFPAMIRDWRRVWGQGEFPFLFVQLANFMAVTPQPVQCEWAELREAQTMTLALPNTGMAVAIDIGDAADIHPRNKQDVGGRLAQWALGTTYGKGLVPSGPLYESMAVEGSKIRLRFRYVGAGLQAKGGGPLKPFAISGEDRTFVWADAAIDGDTVVVSSPQVAKPVAVRYAWANNPEGCNLVNRDGLPASPFRTDDWPGITAGRK